MDVAINSVFYRDDIFYILNTLIDELPKDDRYKKIINHCSIKKFISLFYYPFRHYLNNKTSHSSSKRAYEHTINSNLNNHLLFWINNYSSIIALYYFRA